MRTKLIQKDCLGKINKTKNLIIKDSVQKKSAKRPLLWSVAFIKMLSLDSVLGWNMQILSKFIKRKKNQSNIDNFETLFHFTSVT